MDKKTENKKQGKKESSKDVGKYEDNEDSEASPNITHEDIDAEGKFSPKK